MNYPANQQNNHIRQNWGDQTNPSGKLSVGEIGKLRSELLRNCPQFDNPAMTKFVIACFEADETVGAYFHSMNLPVLTKARVPTGRTIKAVAFTHAHRAAVAARNMALISGDSEHHRKLVFLAALLAPAVLFLNACPACRNVASAAKPLNQHLGELRTKLFLKPLRDLSKRDRESTVLLATLLGFRSSIPVDEELVSRLEAAVLLATLSVMTIWRTNR